MLRIPGYNHCKHEPHEVRLERWGGKKYTREEILKSFPSVLNPTNEAITKKREKIIKTASNDNKSHREK